MESVEASGKSIEDAILQALVRLGRNRNEVEIAVLQEPTRRTRETAAREARVRVTVRPQYAGARASQSAGYGDLDEMDDLEAPYAAAPNSEPDADDEEYEDEFEQELPYDDTSAGAASGFGATTDLLAQLLPEDASIEEMAVAGLEILLAQMGIPAAVEVAPAENEDEPLTLNIRSRDERVLALLIGRRGETLAAIQLLLNLVITKQSQQRERIIVDVEGYRQRREANLRSMAQRVAQQVRRSGAPITLEAMPPNERRIIHMELADYRDISTESSGEGDQRRIVVALKSSR